MQASSESLKDRSPQRGSEPELEDNLSSERMLDEVFGKAAEPASGARAETAAMRSLSPSFWGKQEGISSSNDPSIYRRAGESGTIVFTDPYKPSEPSLGRGNSGDSATKPGKAGTEPVGAETKPAETKPIRAGTESRISVILVDNVSFPGKIKANQDSGLYDEVLPFRKGGDLPRMMQELKGKYPGSEFDITVETHGNRGRPEGYKLAQKNGKVEYVKYGALEEALHGAGLHEDKVRIFYGGCNAATGYYNAKLSETAKRYGGVTWGADTANNYEDNQATTEFIRVHVNDPRYGLLRDIKKPNIDERDSASHEISQAKIDELTALAKKYRKSDPAAYEERVRKLAATIQHPKQYMHSIESRPKPRISDRQPIPSYYQKPQR